MKRKLKEQNIPQGMIDFVIDDNKKEGDDEKKTKQKKSKNC